MLACMCKDLLLVLHDTGIYPCAYASRTASPTCNTHESDLLAETSVRPVWHTAVQVCSLYSVKYKRTPWRAAICIWLAAAVLQG